MAITFVVESERGAIARVPTLDEALRQAAELTGHEAVEVLRMGRLAKVVARFSFGQRTA